MFETTSQGIHLVPQFPTPERAFFALFSLGILYTFWKSVYNLYFHPLRKYPGPRLAALSKWYEFYFDVYKGGRMPKNLVELHKVYGPVVRIGPDHLHVNDVAFYDEIFNSKSKYIKSTWFFGRIAALSESLASLADPHKHRTLRTMVNPAFSLQAVERQAPVITVVMKKMVRILGEHCQTGLPLDVQTMYHCATIDVISRALFGNSMELLDVCEPTPAFVNDLRMFTQYAKLNMNFPIVPWIACQLPMFVARRLAPGYAQFRHDCAGWVKEAMARTAGNFSDGKEETIFDMMLKGRRKGKALTVSELIDNALMFLAAGSNTLTFSLSNATYQVLANPHALEKLNQELSTVPREAREESGAFPYRSVATLPYLAAVVKETLRISTAVPGVFPRDVPAGGTTVQGIFIPAGASVSTVQGCIHFNPKIFPEPERFLPERWLGEEAKGLDKYLVSFAKGRHQCIGMNLVYMELFTTIATLFGNFSPKLYNTNATSMQSSDYVEARNHKNVEIIVEPKIV